MEKKKKKSNTKTRPGVEYLTVPAAKLCDEFQESYVNTDLLQATDLDSQRTYEQYTHRVNVDRVV